MNKNILSIFFFSFLLHFSVSAEIVQVFDFTKEEMENLKVRKVKGKTSYTLGQMIMAISLKLRPKEKALALVKRLRLTC